MTNVYVVVEGEHSVKDNVGVFATRTLAERFVVAKARDDWQWHAIKEPFPEPTMPFDEWYELANAVWDTGRIEEHLLVEA